MSEMISPGENVANGSLWLSQCSGRLFVEIRDSHGKPVQCLTDPKAVDALLAARRLDWNNKGAYNG